MMEQIALAADKLAQAILDMINSKPRSPTKDELVTLLVAHLGMARAEMPTNSETEEADAAFDTVREVKPPAPELPFMSHRPERRDLSLHGTGRCFWEVKSGGIWHEDCDLGEEYARIYLEHLRKTGKPYPLMCWIVNDMVAARRWSGVECGFVQTVFSAIQPR